MIRFIYTLIFILLVSIRGYSQTITINAIGTHSVTGIPITVEHLITTGNGVTSVKVFRTHYGTGSTAQYQQYPSTRTEMDKLFNSSYAATTLWWTGNLNATTSLNFTNYTTLTSAGASIPSSGNYYATEVTFTFVPLETGTYSFGMTSDDGSDLSIDGTSVIEYYGGKGVGTYKYGTYSMTAGTQYTIIARMQEYSGGDGLVLRWKRPSQSSWSLQTNEIGVSSTSWTSQGTKYTDTFGKVTFTNSSNLQYRVTVTSPTYQLNVNDANYLTSRILQPDSVIGFDWYTLDLNGDSLITTGDLISFYYSLNNYSLPVGAFFTQSEYNSIVNSTTSLKSTYPPANQRVITNENTFYMPVITKPTKSFKSVGELE